MPRESPREGADEVPGWWWAVSLRSGCCPALGSEFGSSVNVQDMSHTGAPEERASLWKRSLDAPFRLVLFCLMSWNIVSNCFCAATCASRRLSASPW